MHPLEVVDGGDPRAVAVALRRALAHEGPAVLPRDPQADDLFGAELPHEVPTAVSLVIETSGSSGAAKRVALSADALLASAAASEGVLGGPGQWLLALPTHYIAGVQVLVRSIAAGTEPVIQPLGHFTPELFAALAGRLEAPLRFSSLVPAQLARLVEAGEQDAGIRRAVARFDKLLVGGQALPDPLHERATALGYTVVRTYGASETAGGCVYDGRPIGRTVARITDGEIELSGPSLAEGYLDDDELSLRSFRTEGGVRWYRTADAGTVIDGVLRVTGRVDNVIISGGVKVSLDRVERIVQGVPGYEEAVVVGRDDERWGQVAVVVVADAGTASEVHAAELRHLRTIVAEAAGRPAAPAGILRLAELPRLSSGKPDRRAIAGSLVVPTADSKLPPIRS
ncbi:AMP-binding protein [Herbiconiux sp.]|uniref:AMP-binding protein n=1 Tax=Herbiconiux sp. TaxID=1871186 RepID=UPI0025BCEC81|nr:AMP-binding protein [Herbiconiux sp.]